MKCKFCYADVEQNARFCTTCGKDLSVFDKCVSCGELIDKGTSVCPYCGTEQPEVEEQTSSKKLIWAIVGVLLVAVIGGGYYFLCQSGSVSSNSTVAVDSDSIAVVDSEYDIHSVEGIKARMTEILNEGMAMPEKDAVKKFFSKDYREAYFKVDEYDNQNIPEGQIGFWDFSMWGDGQGGLGNFHSNVLDVQNIKESSALVIVEYVSDEIEGAKMVTNFNLVFEDGNWLINEVTDENALSYKEAMREYLNQIKSKDSSTAINGTYSMAGEVSNYKIHMTIEIDGTNVKGYYYYDSQGSSNRVRLEGAINENREMKLFKFDTNGEETGYFSGAFDGATYCGENVNYQRNNSLAFSLTVK